MSSARRKKMVPAAPAARAWSRTCARAARSTKREATISSFATDVRATRVSSSRTEKSYAQVRGAEGAKVFVETEIVPGPVGDLSARKAGTVEDGEPGEGGQARAPGNRAGAPQFQRGFDLHRIEERRRGRGGADAGGVGLHVVEHRGDFFHAVRELGEIGEARPMREGGNGKVRDRFAKRGESRGVVAEETIRAIEIELEFAAAGDRSQLVDQAGERGGGEGRSFLGVEADHRDGVKRPGAGFGGSGFPAPDVTAIFQFADVPVKRPHFLVREFGLFLAGKRLAAVPDPVRGSDGIGRKAGRAEEDERETDGKATHGLCVTGVQRSANRKPRPRVPAAKRPRKVSQMLQRGHPGHYAPRKPPAARGEREL